MTTLVKANPWDAKITSSDKREARDRNCLAKTMTPKGVLVSQTNRSLIKWKGTKTSCRSHSQSTCPWWAKIFWCSDTVSHCTGSMKSIESVCGALCVFSYTVTKGSVCCAGHPEICKQHVFFIVQRIQVCHFAPKTQQWLRLFVLHVFPW